MLDPRKWFGEGGVARSCTTRTGSDINPFDLCLEGVSQLSTELMKRIFGAFEAAF